jgi:hypothetical protein
MRNFIDLASSECRRSGAGAVSFIAVIRSLGSNVAVWIRTCADYYAAAAMYEELSGLSDAELKRRGLARRNLARDVCETRDHAHRSL